MRTTLLITLKVTVHSHYLPSRALHKLLELNSSLPFVLNGQEKIFYWKIRALGLLEFMCITS
jgi:hypothetical protein